jgi:glutathione S-transferase
MAKGVKTAAKAKAKAKPAPKAKSAPKAKPVAGGKAKPGAGTRASAKAAPAARKAPAAKPSRKPVAERRPARPVLHGLWLSIPACKIGLALNMMGVAFDYRHVDLPGGAHKAPDFLSRNRFGQVPVLEHEGHHIAQSNVILHYLADAYGKFLGRTAAEEIRVAEWLQWDQDRMSALAMLRSFKRFPRYTPHPEVMAFMAARATQALDMLDRQLEGSRFVAGAQPTIADIALFTTVALADEAEMDIARWPHVAAWAARVRALPGASHPYDAMPREDRIGA